MRGLRDISWAYLVGSPRNAVGLVDEGEHSEGRRAGGALQQVEAVLVVHEVDVTPLDSFPHILLLLFLLSSMGCTQGREIERSSFYSFVFSISRGALRCARVHKFANRTDPDLIAGDRYMVSMGSEVGFCLGFCV